jgi:uncharacterized membrane protein YqaE (UPF0057 family)
MNESKKDFFRILIAIVVPPVGVFLQVGMGWQFWINLLLTFLGYIPGIVHGIYIILVTGDAQLRA